MIDLVNAVFVTYAVCMAWADAIRVYRGETELSGVGWGTAILLTAWPAWDLVFYASLSQWVSFFACTMLFSGRLWWLMLLRSERVD